MDYRSLLNENQYEAVSTTSQHTRIVAGAGSGKTRVLTYRISYLISEMGVSPSKIVAIAFTNKVAEEMKNRALSLLSGYGHGLTVSTFHSYCAKFLRQEIDNIGFPNNFTIMDDDDTTKLIKDIAVEIGFKRNDDIVKYSMAFISSNKCEGKYASDVILDRHSSDKQKKALEIFHKYEERKNQMFSLDFDDLLLRTIEILENYPEVQMKWRNKISHILIDEFQDVNDIQYKLVRLLMKEDTCLYVVGDPDQTIYTWRGANQDIILNYTKDYPLAKTIILDRNYRSTKAILDSANKLISYNKKRVPKNLYTKNDGGEDVRVKCCYSKEEEAKYVIDQIEYLVNSSKDITYRDIAILYRAAYLTLPFENELMRRKIPYVIYGSVKFYQRKEIKDVLAYFRLIFNEKDDISFERIANVPRRNIGDKTLDLLKSEKDAAGLSYLEYLREIDKYDTEVKPKSIMSLTFLLSKIEATRKRLEEKLEAYPKILEDFITEIGYYDYLSSDDEGEDRLENVKTLFGTIVDFVKKYPESSFQDYLENASLQSAQDEITDGEHLSLMTVHVAKGLEFPYVFVVAMNDGVFPSHRTVDENGDKGIEEERRLAYVAFTRAKKRLSITFNSSFNFVLNERTEGSQFIKEAGLVTMREQRYEPTPRYSNIYKQTGFFKDPSYDYFEEEEEDETPPMREDNGIYDWKVGDIAIHDVFGRGIVTAIIDDTIIEVDFEAHGKKSILSTHPKIHREEKGGVA